MGDEWLPSMLPKHKRKVHVEGGPENLWQP